MFYLYTFSGNPTLGQTGQSFSLDHSATGKRPDTLKSPQMQLSIDAIEEDGESAGQLALGMYLYMNFIEFKSYSR